MASVLNFTKVSALPEVLVANTMYIVPSSKKAGLVDFYITDRDGQHAYNNMGVNDLNSIFSYATEAPDLSGLEVFWWDPVAGQLMVKYNDGSNVGWIEATPATPVPGFGGNGTAATMSHSDHTHETIDLIESDW